MSKLGFFLFIIAAISIYANDGWISSSGGNITALDEINPNVKMVSENIKIDLYDNYYEMNIEFNFYNFGDTVDLKVGFPEYSREVTRNSGIRDFKTSVNNEIKEFEIINVPKPYDESTWDPSKVYIIFWYVKNVTFKGNDYTVSRVHYKADYASTSSLSDNVFGVHYLYGTGSTWKDKIDQINIEVVNHNNFWVLRTFFKEGYNYKLERINDNTINIQLKDISPDYYEFFSIVLAEFHKFDFGFIPGYKEETRWELRRRILTNNELVLLNKEQLRILRNSIYATHGYSFMSADLREYFSKRDWYKINANFSERNFFENERINLDNIIKDENRRN